MSNNVLVLYTQQQDKAKATSVPSADAFRLKFTRDLEKGCAVVDAEKLPPPIMWEYEIMIFLAHGMLIGSHPNKRGVMSATGGKGRCAGLRVCNYSIATTILRYRPKFILFVVCHMGTGTTFRTIYDSIEPYYHSGSTCLLCGHADATPFLRDLPLSLFGNRFYGRSKDGVEVDTGISVPPQEFRIEFEEIKRKAEQNKAKPT